MSSVLKKLHDKFFDGFRKIIKDEVNHFTQLQNETIRNVVVNELNHFTQVQNEAIRNVAVNELNHFTQVQNEAIRNVVVNELNHFTQVQNEAIRNIVVNELNHFTRLQNESIKNNNIRIGEMISKFISASFINRDTFKPFRNYCKGKKIVICGAGPSLNDYEPIPDAVHIALNRAFVFSKVEFDFVFAQDYEGVYMLKDKLRDYRKGKCIKLFGKLFRDGAMLKTNFPESYITECDAKTFATDAFYPTDLFSDHPFIAEIDSRAISCGTNVGMCAMQFALWMNPDEIYLVGCDQSGGHFTQEGLSEELRKKDSEHSKMTWESTLSRARGQWEELRTFAQIYYPEIKIISVNPVGLKGIFTDWDQRTGEIIENKIDPLTSILDSEVK